MAAAQGRPPSAAGASASADGAAVLPPGWRLTGGGGRHAIALHWTRTGARTRVTARRPVSLSGAQDLALRLFVPPNSRGTQLDVTLTDTTGHRATLGRIHADGLPGSERTASYWGREFRVPLTAATRAGLDLLSVKSLELAARSSSGRAWLVDAWGWRPVGRPRSVRRRCPAWTSAG
ncbi:hypothetical protein ACF09H_12020 [Streptomyces sp. NPDC014983]|uniref:hypothetical protein n=1 Tax=Streptomyces sp. NPDC014983 TaxID=3364933 RepID=UPI0036F6851E